MGKRVAARRREVDVQRRSEASFRRRPEMPARIVPRRRQTQGKAIMPPRRILLPCLGTGPDAGVFHDRPSRTPVKETCIEKMRGGGRTQRRRTPGITHNIS